MKKATKRALLWIASIAVLATMVPAFSLSFAAEEVPALSASLFESGNSFLTLDQYTGLGFSLGSAAVNDRNPDAHPLQGNPLFELQEVKYGWSNPQVIAVMLSSPYWNELNYGTDMNAAGSTSFLISSGVETGESETLDLALGLSISASATAEVFGNGGEIGAELKTALTQAVEIQSSKATTTTLTYQAGAGEDHVALAVFPVATYRYIYDANGEKEEVYTNVQLEPTSTVTTLANYNRVLHEHNAAQTEETKKLPMIDMSYIRPQYTVGDPSTGFLSASDIPGCLLFENGKLIAADESIAPENYRLVGDVYVSSDTYSVSVGNADSGAESSLEVSSSSGHSHSLGVMLDAGIYGQLSEGFDIGVVEVSASQRLTVSGSLGMAVSHATLNTESVAYSMGFIDLPASAQTGVTGAGVAKSDYAFNAKLAVWTPHTVGSHVPCAPSIIGSIVEFTDPDAMPLYLPDDLHVAQVTDSSVTLAWHNPEFTADPFNKRKPTVYEIVAMASGSGSPAYTTVGSVSADSESYTVAGLSPDTTYTYLLRASDGNGRYSAYGPSVTVDTNGTGGPSITGQPVDTVFAVGDQPLFSIDVQKTNDSHTLSYNWYILETTRYGCSWKFICEKTDNTFNAAYFDPNGVITASNRFDLDDTIYRCVVVENGGGSAVAVTSNAVTLSIVTSFRITSYDELRDVALKIQKGSKTAAGGQYTLVNDITCPTDEAWTVPIGSSSVPFTGTFDGQGHTINGLNAGVSTQPAFGFFGVLDGATVQNLHLTNANLRAGDAHVGGICGKAYNTHIVNCTVSGAVGGSAGEGGGVVGGICGSAYDGTVIEKCINYSDLDTQADATGGICGVSYGTVRGCANQGDFRINCPYFDHMPTITYVGGIVGRVYGANGAVSHCYNVGTTTYVPSYAHLINDQMLCNGGTVTDSYFLSGGASSACKTAEQFASGEVAYLLNNGVTDGTQAWYQNIDNGLTADPYPTLVNNDSNTVYILSESDKTYSNSSLITGDFLLQHADVRSYRPLMHDSGIPSDQSVVSIGNARVDNQRKIITLYVPQNEKRVGLLKHQGADGARGVLTLQGAYPVLDKTITQLLNSGEAEPAVYTDANGCVVICLPDDGSALPELTIRYAANAMSEQATIYTLRIERVDAAVFESLGATTVETLSQADPDYAVLHGSDSATTTTTPSQTGVSPETGDATRALAWLAMACAALCTIVMCARKKKTV